MSYTIHFSPYPSTDSSGTGSFTTPAGTASWQLGEPKPEIHPSYIESLEASGPELGHIAVSFVGVPLTQRGVCVWRNEMAIFLFENL